MKISKSMLQIAKAQNEKKKIRTWLYFGSPAVSVYNVCWVTFVVMYYKAVGTVGKRGPIAPTPVYIYKHCNLTMSEL